MRKLLFSLILSAAAAQAQGQAVNQVTGPPPYSWVSLLFYNGSNQLTYACYAPAFGPLTTYSRADSSLTSVVVVTNVGTINFAATAQLWVGQRIEISGSTTAALNGIYKITAVSGTTATITTAGVADATYNNAAMTVKTNAPVMNAALWSIQALTYVGSNLATVYWAGSAGISVSQGLACSARATY